MEWRDHGILLARRRHGETSAIIEVFTPEHGRHAGVVRGGAGRRMGPVLQPGTFLDLTWRARLEDHLGSFSAEPLGGNAALMLADPPALSALNAICGLLAFALPERVPHPALYAATAALLESLARQEPGWPRAYLHWEMLLLAELGFGLDLSSCAVTGRREGLAYVSPKTGRAVTREGAGEWASRLLPLPDCLREGAGGEGAPDGGLLEGLAITGHFLAHHLAPSLGDRPLPGARQRLIDTLARLQRGTAEKTI